jgi:hypothetical protein
MPGYVPQPAVYRTYDSSNFQVYLCFIKLFPVLCYLLIILSLALGLCYDSSKRVKLPLSTLYESATIDYYLSSDMC